MTIDSSTKTGSLFLFSITSTFLTFVIVHMKPKYLQKKDKTINLPETIGLAILISLLFTTVITYISIKVDNQKLQTTKKI
jgi:UDP-N-acetylmuramyl pentapeptide phosphotransferase/UDP-N-acetylglucosamine-1-phosphate transferase